MTGNKWRLSRLIAFGLAITSTVALVQSPPRIVKQPPSDELPFQVAQRPEDTDKPFIIECEAEGEPSPKYTWKKNGVEFDWQARDNRINQQSGRGTLIFLSPKAEDVGQYQCFATNELGTATSNSVFARKSDLSNFKDEPATSTTAQEGQPFSLRCQPPEGWPKPSIYWIQQNSNGALRSINSSRITVDPEGTLWFSNVTKDDANDEFMYACSATSLFRSEYKFGNRVYLDVSTAGGSATVNRVEPVTQYLSNRSLVAYRGKKIELWCIFGGTPLPEVRWKKNKLPIAAGRISYSNFGKTLVIKSVDFDDAGSYECEATNGVGSPKTHVVDLQVNAAPYFIVEPQIINAAEEETVTFECKAGGFPEPQIRWIHNGRPIEESPDNPRRTIQTNPHRIVFENLEKSDTGNYGCNATNSIGYVYKDVYLNVLALPPEFEEYPRDTATVEGATVNVTCKVFGAPKPFVKWEKDGVTVSDGRMTVYEDGTLEIRGAAFSDAGNYTCHASNKFGTTHAVAALLVKEKTRITEGPEDYEVAAGQTATFRCNAVSDSSLNLTIEWLFNGHVVDFEQEPRFVQSRDNVLTITKSAQSDTGSYTCIARTALDTDSSSAVLVVQDVPNAPRLEGAQCNTKDAVVEWTPMGDNRAPILGYTIQYSTSFVPDTWEVSFENVPATETRFKVEMSPWTNYTFRVIARNKIGPSLPSEQSNMCSTPPDVPYKNPDNVDGKGTTPTNLVISWTPMQEIEHNGNGFHYRVYWKRDLPGENWNVEQVEDWKESSLTISNQPTFKKYRVKVVAINELGEANVAAQEVTGYSGEDVPLDAPLNLTIFEVIDERRALLAWNPVSPESVQGHFRGYKIETWTDKESPEKAREMVVASDATKALVSEFVPFSTNYVRVRVVNGAYVGPASETLSFKTPQGRPGEVDFFEAIPLGSNAFYLIWKQPDKPNGIITGYNIYYHKIEGTKVGPIMKRDPQITDGKATRAKLSGLDPNTKYRLHVKATTIVGEGGDFYIERSTRGGPAMKPDKPQFTFNIETVDDGVTAVKVTWTPEETGHAGSHFYAQYRPKGGAEFESTKPEMKEHFVYVTGVQANQVYEFRIVAVDGEHETESDIEEVAIYSDDPLVQAPGSVATAGWFIGMMLAIALLLLVLILVLIIKRNRGGKYAVHEREAAHGRKDYADDAGFHEYSQPIVSSKAPSKTSLASDTKAPPESDDSDSMAEYGDGEAGEFAEDGSFIGQYRQPSPTQAGVAAIV